MNMWQLDFKGGPLIYLFALKSANLNLLVDCTRNCCHYNLTKNFGHLDFGTNNFVHIDFRQLLEKVFS